MRVIAGEKKHLLLKTLSSLDIRPTTDKIKETLFNMIQFDLDGINFLDLFAGTGAIGIEALSRGAKFATFVDVNREAIKIINENLTTTKLLDRAEVIQSDVLRALEILSKKNIKYDIIFLDPPYNKNLHVEPLKFLSDSNLLYDETKIIIETNIKDNFDEVLNFGYELIRVKEYNNKKHTFLKRIKD